MQPREALQNHSSSCLSRWQRLSRLELLDKLVLGRIPACSCIIRINDCLRLKLLVHPKMLEMHDAWNPLLWKKRV